MTKRPNTSPSSNKSEFGPRKHLSLLMIMVFNVVLLVIIILIGGIFSYIDIQSGRNMSKANLVQTQETMDLLAEIIKKQLPLKKQVSTLRIAIIDFRNILDLFILEENGNLDNLRISFADLQHQSENLEKIWIPDPSVNYVKDLKTQVNSTLTYIDELKGRKSVEFAEQNYLVAELMASVGILIPLMDQIDDYLDSKAENTYAKVLESNRLTTENAGALASLIDIIERQYFTILLIVIGIVIFFQVAFFYILKKRLGSLIRITSMITNSGNLSQRVGWITSDEIGTLTQSFNRMLDRLETAHIEISSNKAYLDDIFHSMLNALVVINPDKTIRTVNQSLLTLLNYKEEELIDLSIEKIFPGHPAHLCPDDFDDLPEQGFLIQGEEHLFLTRDRIIVPVLLSCSVIRDLTGKNPGMVCVAQDISQLKHMERERQKLEDQLQQSQKMEAIGTLAGGIAHDFNNILSTMQGFTWLLLADKAEDSEERDYLNEIYMAGERATSLIQQILTFSRTDKQELKPLKLSPLIKEALRFMRATIPKSVEIKQRIESDCPVVLANATQVHQIIINLCTNALQAMKNEQGSLTITLDLADPTVDHQLTQEFPDDSFVRIKVKDTGHGIHPKIKDRIFDPFFTTKDIGEGTGLGLSVVHGIVENHSGRIFVESDTGVSTTFQIYFPVYEIEDVEDVEEEQYKPTKGNEHILIVEDEPSLAKFYEIALSQLGYRVSCEKNGQSALERFKQNPDTIDIVFTDQAMPLMSGTQLSEELLAIDPDLPIILVTGYKGESLKNKALKIGIRHFLEKPVNIGKLTQIVRDIFDSIFVEADDLEEMVKKPTDSKESYLDNAEDVIHQNEEFKDIIPLFLEERHKEIKLVLEAAEQGNYEEIYSLGHKMQGASEAFGFTTVSKIGMVLKESSMKGDNVLINNKIEELKEYLFQLEKDQKI